MNNLLEEAFMQMDSRSWNTKLIRAVKNKH